jgi:hypothetical protein
MLKRFLKKITSPTVPAYQVVDFMAKYDGAFIKLDCFNILYKELAPHINQFKENIMDKNSHINSFNQLHFAVWNYKGDEFNCIIFSFDVINGRYSSIMSDNIPFLTILQVGQDVYISEFGRNLDTLPIDNIKNIIKVGVNNGLFPENHKIHNLTNEVIEKPFTFKGRQPPLVYKLSIANTEYKTNSLNTGLGSSTIWQNGKPTGLTFDIKVPAFSVDFPKAQINSWKMDVYGDIFIGGEYFVYTTFGDEEKIPDYGYYLPSFFIGKYDDILVNEVFELYFDHILTGNSDHNFDNEFKYCRHYITLNPSAISHLPQKLDDKTRTYLKKRLQAEEKSNIDIEYVMKNIKGQLLSLQEFKLQNQKLIQDALSELQEIEVI